jgi:malate dehydrogenase (oxaloacetate-decarboxylating)
MGLGALVGEAMRITDRMFLVAARALSDLVTPELRAEGLLLPEMSDVRRVSRVVAFAVAREARDAGFARNLSDEELEAAVARAQWDPHYYPYRAG